MHTQGGTKGSESPLRGCKGGYDWCVGIDRPGNTCYVCNEWMKKTLKKLWAAAEKAASVAGMNWLQEQCNLSKVLTEIKGETNH